eukprot:CAMPEP_0198253962 /NCGR_PEP_ID=MMETSP1447-20131203/4337_1 /TAXON_ID=420782 /ORGANISM="Chaetoceros dichaeta, Strain CCMP1751" /LENGTH=335 /DNA_ID=CAMNT_0043939843 /DNA_START=97 /DNA_END=1104 /DNA_ORIENTATION=+
MKTFSKSTSGEKGDAVILKNVIDMGDRYGAEVVENEDASSVLSKVLADSGREEALFFIHGWHVSCRVAIDTVVIMNKVNDNEEDSPKRLLVLPIIWAATWDNLSYGDDRNTSAPEAAMDFSGLSTLMSTGLQNSSVKKSIIAQSMGNYVLRIFAQNHTGDQPVFENIFMVAPDVRWDLFNEDYISRGEIETQQNTVTTTISSKYSRNEEDISTTSDVDNPLEGKAIGGLKIAALAKNKVHVLYTVDDKALLFRQSWHRFGGAETSALGRCAGFAMDTVHSSLKDKVVFHDCGYIQPCLGLKHSYYNTAPAMVYYESPEPNGIKTKARLFFPGSNK